MNEDLRKMLEAAREASRRLNRCQEADINRLLLSAADKVEAAIDKILAANATDLARMDKDNPKYDRLKLTPRPHPSHRRRHAQRGVVAVAPSPHIGRMDTAQRDANKKSVGPVRCGRRNLRGASQCHV